MIPDSVRPCAVLDTDTFNEVDDQFALAHLLLSSTSVNLEAVYAAPFFNTRSTGPADGMEKSYEEIHRVLKLVGGEARPPVFRGSTAYLPSARTPVNRRGGSRSGEPRDGSPRGEALRSHDRRLH